MFWCLSNAVLAVLLASQAPGQAAPPVAGQQTIPAPGQPATKPAAASPFDAVPPRPAFLLRPSFALNDVGIDTNVLGTAVDPQRDSIGRVRLRAKPSLELGPVSLNGTAAIGLSYFRQLTEQRSVDTDDSFKLDLRLNRVTLYASDGFLRTRDVFSPELDVRLQRTEVTSEAGLNVRATGKTVVGAGIRRHRFSFGADSLSSFDLRDSLTRTEDTLTASLRNAVTPLTTFVVAGDVERDRFDFSTLRDAGGVRVMTGLEFKPTALVSGKAYVGYRTRKSSNGSYPDAGALVASLDLGYSPWAPVMFGIQVDRDLDHSFMASERYYIVTGFTGSVTVRVANAWEAGATVGRQRLDYGASTLPDLSLAALDPFETVPWSEYVVHYGGTVAYRMAFGAVLRFNADSVRRDSALALRTYDRLRLVSSLTFGFE